MVTANLSWVAASGAVSYKVEYKLNSSPTWILFNASVTGTTAAIPNLDEGMAYDFRITSNCTSGVSSPITQTMSTPCRNVENLTAGFVGTDANLTWDKKPQAVEYTIEYKLQSSSTWTTAAGSPLNNAGLPSTVPFTVSSLTPGQAYDFRVTVVCQSGTSTGEVVSATSSCIAPTGLTISFT